MLKIIEHWTLISFRKGQENHPKWFYKMKTRIFRPRLVTSNTSETGLIRNSIIFICNCPTPKYNPLHLHIERLGWYVTEIWKMLKNYREWVCFVNLRGEGNRLASCWLRVLWDFLLNSVNSLYIHPQLDSWTSDTLKHCIKSISAPKASLVLISLLKLIKEDH